MENYKIALNIPQGENLYFDEQNNYFYFQNLTNQCTKEGREYETDFQSYLLLKLLEKNKFYFEKEEFLIIANLAQVQYEKTGYKIKNLQYLIIELLELNYLKEIIEG